MTVILWLFGRSNAFLALFDLRGCSCAIFAFLFLLSLITPCQSLWVSQIYKNPTHQVLQVSKFGMERGAGFKFDVAWKSRSNVFETISTDPVNMEKHFKGIDVLVCHKSVFSDSTKEGRWDVSLGFHSTTACSHIDRLRDCLIYTNIKPSYYRETIISNRTAQISKSSLTQSNAHYYDSSTLSNIINTHETLNYTDLKQVQVVKRQLEIMGHARLEGKVPADWTPPETLSSSLLNGAGPGIYIMLILNCNQGHGPLRSYFWNATDDSTSNGEFPGKGFTEPLASHPKLETITVEGIFLNPRPDSHFSSEIIQIDRVYVVFSVLWIALLFALWANGKWIMAKAARQIERSLRNERESSHQKSRKKFFGSFLFASEHTFDLPIIHTLLKLAMIPHIIYCIYSAFLMAELKKNGFVHLMGILKPPRFASQMLQSEKAIYLNSILNNNSNQILNSGLSHVYLTTNGTTAQKVLSFATNLPFSHIFFYPILPWIIQSFGIAFLCYIILYLSKGGSVTRYSLAKSEIIQLILLSSLVGVAHFISLPATKVIPITLPSVKLVDMITIQMPIAFLFVLLVAMVCFFKSALASIAYQLHSLGLQISLISRFGAPFPLQRPLWKKADLIRRLQAGITISSALLSLIVLSGPFLIKEKSWLVELFVQMILLGLTCFIAWAYRLNWDAFEHVKHLPTASHAVDSDIDEPHHDSGKISALLSRASNLSSNEGFLSDDDKNVLLEEWSRTNSDIADNGAELLLNDRTSVELDEQDDDEKFNSTSILEDDMEPIKPIATRDKPIAAQRSEPPAMLIVLYPPTVVNQPATEIKPKPLNEKKVPLHPKLQAKLDKMKSNQTEQQNDNLSETLPSTQQASSSTSTEPRRVIQPSLCVAVLENSQFLDK